MSNTKDLLRRSRNLLSHPPTWWKDNEAARERLIAELDVAQAEPVQEPLTEDEITRCFKEAGITIVGQAWTKAIRAIERAHGIGEAA